MVQMAVSPLPQWFEGSEYTHKVAACIMKYGPISRITLAQILGLSQGAVSRITSDLIYAGVIEETPMPSGKAGKLPKGFVQKENTDRRGRPQTGLQVIANARSFVGSIQPGSIFIGSQRPLIPTFIGKTESDIVA